MSEGNKAEWLQKHHFKPGESGNPKGRPKGSRNRKKIIEELFNSPDPTGAGYENAFQRACAAIISKAIETGEHKGILDLKATIDGKPHQTQSVELETTDRSSILDEVRAMRAEKQKIQKDKKK